MSFTKVSSFGFLFKFMSISLIFVISSFPLQDTKRIDNKK